MHEAGSRTCTPDNIALTWTLIVILISAKILMNRILRWQCRMPGWDRDLGSWQPAWSQMLCTNSDAGLGQDKHLLGDAAEAHLRMAESGKLVRFCE